MAATSARLGRGPQHHPPGLPSYTHVSSPSSGLFHRNIESGRLLLGTGGEPEDVRVELLQNIF